ncbi:integrase core domain-containing protein [Methylobacterium mesophilicum]
MPARFSQELPSGIPSTNPIHQTWRRATLLGQGQEIFWSLEEAQAVIAFWQITYNHIWPHSSLGYRPPVPVSYPDLAFRLPMAAAMQ